MSAGGASCYHVCTMKATGEIQVIPIGVGTSVRAQVRRAHAILSESGLTIELHGQGTNVEGELSDILAVIERIHTMLHDDGVPRLVTSIKLGTRTDHEPSLAAKVRAVTG